MRNGLRLLVWVFLALLFLVSICNFILARIGYIYPSSSKGIKLTEKYDPSLARLNSEIALEKYADSQYYRLPTTEQDSAAYTSIIEDLVQRRFYHGVLTYGPGDNFLAWVAAKVSGRSWNEVWIADHVLKHSKAICGQQSVVVMSILKKKGFPVRGVYFQHPALGHFGLEAYYSGAWHFFDPDIEPDAGVLLVRNRPSIAALVKDTALLIKAYRHRESKLMVELLNNYHYGPENEPVPSRIYLFQQATFWISQSLWIFILLGGIFFFKRKSNLHLKQAQSI